jgi:hypothetical protein
VPGLVFEFRVRDRAFVSGSLPTLVTFQSRPAIGPINYGGILMKTLIAAIVTVFCASTAAMAEGTSQGYGMGGQFARFDSVVARYNQSGELFRIVGHCQSACTMFLGIRNACIERGARLLFHAGRDPQHNVSAWSTSHMMATYNGNLRNYLQSNGYMSTFAFHTISGQDMISKFGYRACPGRG